MLTKYRMLMTIAVIFTLSIVGFDNVFASDYMENKEKLEQEGNKVLIKKMENIYLKMLWGTEIARDEFNDVEKKPFNDINGTTLDEIENGKLELRELPSQSAIFRIMSNDIILKNRNMFVDDEIKKLNFNEKYICLSGVQTEEGTTTYTDPECRHRKEQAYINCGNRGDEACVRSIAMQGLHYYDECKKQRTVMYEKCEKAVGVGYVDGRLLAVIPYDDFEWEQSVKDIPIQAILNKLATNYGKPDKIIKREFSSLREDCKILSDFLRQNNLTMPFSCTENTESYFWIEKPWVQTIEIVFDENNNPQTITRSIINYQRYKSIAEEEKAVQEQLRRDAEKRQEDERKRLEQEKQQKIDNFNI